MGTECNSALSITRGFLYPSDLGKGIIQSIKVPSIPAEAIHLAMTF
ncbi:hypothetical protein [Flavobacterium sp.]